MRSQRQRSPHEMVTHYSEQRYQKRQADQQIYFQMIGLTSHLHSGSTRPDGNENQGPEPINLYF